MDSPKYLIIIDLIDGQNFTVPDGAPDKVEASIFAEARFGNESILRSDTIKLTSSNPEFATELAWQLDKKNLHQLRIERKAIKLQVFMQTRERRKSSSKLQQDDDNNCRIITNGASTANLDTNGETHKVELIGYTVLDLRSAQPREHVKFHWYPLLNPKFRKPSYNRPEIQLAITMSRLDEDESVNQADSLNQFSSISTLPDGDISIDYVNSGDPENEKNNLDIPRDVAVTDVGGYASTQDSSDSTKLYRTCLDITTNGDPIARHQSSQSKAVYNDEIIDNDIIIRSAEGIIYIYDAKHPRKFTLDDCNEHYTLTVTIPFATHLDLLVKSVHERFYFSINLLGSVLETELFNELTSINSKDMTVQIMTTHAGVLATYFELNSNLDIKLYQAGDNNRSAQCVGLATIQLNQLCSLDTTCRSIEGIFALQSPSTDNELGCSSPIENPSIGVSVILEKYDPTQPKRQSESHEKRQDSSRSCAKRQSKTLICDDFDLFFKSFHDTHQLTLDDSAKSSGGSLLQSHSSKIVGPKVEGGDKIVVEDHNDTGPSHDDHHYCFTIDLKEFSYTQCQRLIPTLRELVIRYSYPFFGYKDTITTDASIPINANSSIIVSGFCEFNFATTPQPLLTALSELPLDLEIIAADEARLRELDGDKKAEQIVASCSICLAQLLNLNNATIEELASKPIFKTTLVPIFALDGDEIGQLQLSLCLKDLGKPKQKFEPSSGNIELDPLQNAIDLHGDTLTASTEARKLDGFLVSTKTEFEAWKVESLDKLSDELRRRDNDRFKRLYQRIEAKEARHDQEFKKKMEDLNNLERKFRYSLNCVESLEKMLVDSLEHLKTKSAILDNRLDMIELKISQVSMCNGAGARENNEHSSPVRVGSKPDRLRVQPQRSFDDNLLKSRGNQHQSTSNSSLASTISPRNGPDKIAPRRSSLRTATGGAAIVQKPATTRSTSLIRRPSEGSTTVTRIVKRISGVGSATVVNEINSRARSDPNKINLSKETLEKLANLRKEKAELLKRGCKPTDDLIREINLLIEKLAY